LTSSLFSHSGRSIEVPDAEYLPLDYADRIKRLRGRMSLTQVQLAGLLGVSFATVNRWENHQSRPSQLAWAQLERLSSAPGEESQPAALQPAPLLLDFTSDPAAVRAVAEGERLVVLHKCA
jgi:DNA-binding XRE family transcriptional regulator